MQTMVVNGRLRARHAFAVIFAASLFLTEPEGRTADAPVGDKWIFN